MGCGHEARPSHSSDTGDHTGHWEQMLPWSRLAEQVERYNDLASALKAGTELTNLPPMNRETSSPWPTRQRGCQAVLLGQQQR